MSKFLAFTAVLLLASAVYAQACPPATTPPPPIPTGSGAGTGISSSISATQTSYASDIEAASQQLQSVSGQHNQAVSDCTNYYSAPVSVSTGTSPNEVSAQAMWVEVEPGCWELIQARNQYISSPGPETTAAYQQKMQAVQGKLNEIVELDSGHYRALWQLGNIARWQGDNAASYNYFRASLTQAQHKNPFMFNQMINSVDSPEMRASLQMEFSGQPAGNSIVSKLLDAINRGINKLTETVSKAKREVARKIEKLARALSLSEQSSSAVEEAAGIGASGGQNE